MSNASLCSDFNVPISTWLSFDNFYFHKCRALQVTFFILNTSNNMLFLSNLESLPMVICKAKENGMTETKRE